MWLLKGSVLGQFKMCRYCETCLVVAVSSRFAPRLALLGTFCTRIHRHSPRVWYFEVFHVNSHVLVLCK